jgi:hypothetical protein
VPFFNSLPESRKPGRPIRIGERNTLADFCHILGGMKIIGIGELPAQLLSEQSSDGGFPHTDYAHDYENQFTLLVLNDVRLL